MNKPVYAVLVNTNGYRDTIECLESVLRSDYPSVRVMVIDNGSRDGSLDRLAAWAAGTEAPPPPRAEAMASFSAPPVAKPVGLVCRPRVEIESGAAVDWDGTRVLVVDCGANLGFAGANNVGFRHVLATERDAYVLMLNNDTVVAPSAISRMVEVAEASPDVGSVGCTLLQYYTPDRVETYAGATVSHTTGLSALIGWGAPRSAPRDAAVRMDFISGCCMLVPRDVVARVGVIDERFFLYCEDTDWGLRITGAGLRLLAAPSGEVWHKGGATAVHRSEFHDYHNVKSVLHLVRKHRPAVLPVTLAYSLARFLLPKLWRRQWGRLRAALRGYQDFWREIGRERRHARSLQVNDSLA